MQKLLFFILFNILALSFTASAQTINLQVKGVEIGTSYSTVVQKLGKPSSSKKGGIVPCGEGDTLLTLHYPGLVLELYKNGEQNFSVFSMEVTSPKWSVSGIRIGAGVKDVKAKLGPSKLSKDEGLDNLNYFITDGYANFYFQNKKLVRVEWEFNFC